MFSYDTNKNSLPLIIKNFLLRNFYFELIIICFKFNLIYHQQNDGNCQKRYCVWKISNFAFHFFHCVASSVIIKHNFSYLSVILKKLRIKPWLQTIKKLVMACKIWNSKGKQLSPKIIDNYWKFSSLFILNS